MANRVVIFPTVKLAQAQNYAEGCNAHYAAEFEPGGAFAYLRQDNEGQHVVPYYGPPWSFYGTTEFMEPTELVALRADGVIHDFAIWPAEEE